MRHRSNPKLAYCIAVLTIICGIYLLWSARHLFAEIHASPAWPLSLTVLVFETVVEIGASFYLNYAQRDPVKPHLTRGY